MQKTLLSALFILVLLASCKLVEDTSTSVTEPEDITVELLQPNGGELIVEGSAYNIRWNSNATQEMYIAFTYDNGQSWYLLADSISNTGIFEWFPVPGTVSTQCKIKVTTVDQLASDISESAFSIVRNTTEAIVLVSPNGSEQIEAGSQYEIKWMSSEIDSVKIEYTVDNGSHWSVIAIDPNNTGIYFWEPVPDISSTLARIRIMDATDGDPYDMSDSVFTILPQPVLEILEPNGGETVYAGSNRSIKWNSQNIRNVDLKYTTNGGADWVLIAEDQPSDGDYLWMNVPASYSSLCRIRIEDSDDGVPFDISDGNFIIANTGVTSDQVITVLNPNGEEEIEAGNALVINWYSANVDSVGIEYTTNNGNDWTLLAIDPTNSGVYYWDPVPNTPSALSKIRVFDAADGIPADTSDAAFTILPEPKIEVLKPNGGETWTVGSSQRIEWYSENIRNVKIAYTTNNGGDWYVITESTASIGYYIWENIPSHNSQLCKVRIYDAEDEQPNDVSDDPFTITDPVIQETITILEPNGGEEFEAGTVQDISWNSNGVEQVKIELSINSGVSWATLADNYENTGQYQWQINNQLNASQCLIRVSDAADGNPVDQSDASFKINPIKSIKVTYPTNGLVFTAGNTVVVTWESSGIEKVGLRYTYTNGQATLDYSGFEILETSIANQGFYETSFSIPSDQYFVEVYDAETGSPKSRSEGNFKITQQIYPSLKLLSPNGGEEFLTSDPMNTYMHEILWESTEIDSVGIYYSLNGGSTWETIVAGMPSSGIYTWVMPQDVAFRSENARVKIVSTADSSMYDISDNVFAVHPQTKLIRVIYPNGAEDEDEVLEPKQPTDPIPAMTWHSAGVYRVRIELSLDNGVTWELIEADYQSTGAYGFPFTFNPSTNARIKITDVSADAGAVPVSDISDHTFYYRVEK